MIRKHVERGFTLMELLVVIVIVAILAAVAVPLYTNYVKDAQRAEAKGAIGAIVTAQQAYFQDPSHNSTYAGPVTFDKNSPLGGTSGLNCDLTESTHNWSFDVTANNGSPPGFTVKATHVPADTTLDLTYIYDRQNGGSFNK
ncbi:MAG TPA: prepilin-type N-terminal cleavage/methylation domain-containing protein [Candidatus Eisenbacteria bacterium]|nr:prepilin-type N-terminal cleavage/methylation domain-containing protein [Candidatus Eisenbacteria bacterium]